LKSIEDHAHFASSNRILIQTKALAARVSLVSGLER
jgi:hypothetical protein